MALIKTQGLHIWFANPEIGLHKVCVTSLDLGDVSYTEIDTTTLCETEMKQSVKGLMEKGESSLGLNLDLSNPAHTALYDLAMDKSDPEVKWVIGCSLDSDVTDYDATLAPTYESSTDTFTLPDKRHWVTATGSVESFPLEIEPDSIMKTTVKINQKTPWTIKRAS